ncbi:Maf1 regulator [Ostreococcus tauri]|uniref:Repressor of RNA polymerase III transcription n=1 Tax=Ostreococcus tauri TaxID=70448 RepID=A0A090N3F9_OSTTA|nr:Maf1 regulator [Ostreococcus tauri]CEF98048.1 Maf1 regulator [Ostreococcus tauri]|eukprot:XP_022839046.1 Maf1 regulator [Ostreococcus tauri]
MKLLVDHDLAALNAFLASVNVGDYVVSGQVENYSCKLAGTDKKLSRSLDAEVVTAMASSPTTLGSSPVGPLTDSHSRKTLIYLILTLNHIYPDYDFSSLRAEHFTKEGTLSSVKADIDMLLMESGKVWSARYGDEEDFLEVLWKTIDDAIDVCDCDVYSYTALSEGDPFTDEGNLWSFNYFFYNKKLKRILYFTMHARSKTMMDNKDEDDDDDDEDLDLGESGDAGTGYTSYDPAGSTWNSFEDSMMFDEMDM